MKTYYNKSYCKAARINSFIIVDGSNYCRLIVTLDGDENEREVSLGEIYVYGGGGLIQYSDYLKDLKREPGVLYKTSDLWLIERYKTASDESIFSIIEDRVFQENFYYEYDDAPQTIPLIEGLSFERPRRMIAQ